MVADVFTTGRVAKMVMVEMRRTSRCWRMTEQDNDTYHDLMNRLWVLTEVIPEHGRVIVSTEMSRRITFLRVNKVWELGGISDCPIVSTEQDQTKTREKVGKQVEWVEREERVAR